MVLHQEEAESQSVDLLRRTAPDPQQHSEARSRPARQRGGWRLYQACTESQTAGGTHPASGLCSQCGPSDGRTHAPGSLLKKRLWPRWRTPRVLEAESKKDHANQSSVGQIRQYKKRPPVIEGSPV